MSQRKKRLNIGVWVDATSSKEVGPVPTRERRRRRYAGRRGSCRKQGAPMLEVVQTAGKSFLVLGTLGNDLNYENR